MTIAIALGAGCGLYAVVISELLLRLLLRFRELDAFRVSISGMMLRGSWVLICLMLGVSTLDSASGGGFVLAVLGTYLLAQIGEGVRFERALRYR